MESGSGLLPQLLFLLILIGINAFFAASEIAIITVNSSKIRRQAEEGNKKAKLLHHLISEPSKFLATIQVGITLSGLLASAVASESFADKLTHWIQGMGVGLNAPLIKLGSVVMITIVLGYITLVLGELVPKRLAMQKPEEVANFSVQPITILLRVASPFVKLLSFSTNLVIRLFGGNPNFREEKITEEEIRLMVDVGREKGVIQRTEQEMIDNIFEFDNTAVCEIMTHRTSVVALPADADAEEILDTVIREKFSRIPVYQDSIDHIVGILHIQDLMPLFKQNDWTGFDLQKHIRAPYFVPVSKKTDELFKELQRHKTHMAVLIDEYGGTAGIVTIEDLLEEIVGNIFDEHDEEIKEIEKINENIYRVDGTVSLEKVAEILELELPEDEYDTLGGFVMGQLGRIPGETEKPELTYGHVLFKVEAVKDKRILKVTIINQKR